MTTLKYVNILNIMVNIGCAMQVVSKIKTEKSEENKPGNNYINNNANSCMCDNNTRNGWQWQQNRARY